METLPHANLRISQNNIRGICAICVQTTKIKWSLFESSLRDARKNTIHLIFFFLNTNHTDHTNKMHSAWQLFHLWNHVDYLSPAYHENLRVFVCTQKARNTQNCDLLHSRSMRMKTFCEFCGFCVRYYFLVSREGVKVAKVFINVITRIKQIFWTGGMFDWQVRTYGPCVLD